MKKIEALINPSNLQSLKQGLSMIGINRITAIETRETHQRGGRALVFRGTEFVEEFTPMTKIEIVVADEMVQSAVGVILEAVTTVKGGEDSIFVSTVEPAFRARNERHAERALHA